jgi:pimeloyl-ACP methyl ester carboxylesterase
MRGRTVAALALVVAAACGGDDEAASPTTDTTAATTTPTTAATTATTAAADAGACGIAGAEDVEIDSGRGDGTTIHGVLAGDGTTAVVLAHESGQDACDWASYVPDLVDAGHTVLAVDLNTVGDRRLDLDVAAGVAEVRARGAERVVAIGASMGGTAAVAAAGAPGTGAAIDGVVSISAPASYLEADALAAAPAVAVPVLFVAAEDDGDAAADARAMADAATASPSAEVVVVPGGRHGTRLLPDTADESAEVRGAIDALLASVQDGG